ncbi:MAG: hypothetical protein JWP58_138 [Hymenobacter sp.]|nr:hypothetical protein [Hymenobacter sp.]
MVERIRTLLESRQLTPTQFADVIGVARPIVSHILSGRNKPSLEVVQRILAALPDLAMPWLLNGTGPMLATSNVAASIGPVPPLAAAVAPEASAVAPGVAPAPADERAPAVGETSVDVLPIPEPVSQNIEKENIKAEVAVVAPLRASTPAPGRNRVAPKRFVVSAAPLDAMPEGPDSIQTPLHLHPQAVTPERLPAGAPVQDPSPSVATPTAEASVVAVAPQPVPADKAPGEALASALFTGGDKAIRRIVIFYRDGSFADYQPE